MEEQLTKYVNENLKYYQDTVVTMVETIQDLKPINKRSQVLLLNLGRELSSYIVRIKEGEYLAKTLGFELQLNEKFEQLYEANNFKVLLENNFVLNSDNVLTTDGKQTFLELFNYLNSNQDAVDKNKAKENESKGNS
jgi:hypothetical protein